MKLALNIVIGLLVVSAIYFGAQFALDKKGSEETAGLETVRPAVSGTVLPQAGSQARTDDFLALLNTAESIDFNSQLFTDDIFLGLENFQQPLPERSVGRVNPFAPFGQNEGGVATSTRTTTP